jgi:hypothetical protein
MGSMAGARIPLKFVRGKTFRFVFRWAQPVLVYREITAISLAAPCRLTVPAHGLLPGWAYRIEGVKGLSALNSDKQGGRWYSARVIDADTLELNDVNTANAAIPYSGGGFVVFNQPVDLNGVDVRMQVRDPASSSTVLYSATSTPAAGLTVDNALKQIRLEIPAVTSAAFTFAKGEYEVEAFDGLGNVSQIARGSFVPAEEVTR